MHKPALLSPLFMALVLSGGCALTPQSRIDKNPAAFSALTPEQQERVKAGKIGVGFDESSVRLALGEPDRIIERETAEGLTQVWLYYTLVPGYVSNPYCTPGFPYYNHPFYCRPVTAAQYEEHMRVLFQTGKVVAIETSR